MKRFYNYQEMTLKDIAEIVGKTDKTVLAKYKEKKALLNNNALNFNVREGKRKKLYFNIDSADFLINELLDLSEGQPLPKKTINSNGEIKLYEYQTINDDKLEILKKELRVVLKNNPKALENFEKVTDEIKEELDKKDKALQDTFFDKHLEDENEKKIEEFFNQYFEHLKKENERLKKDIRYFKKEYRKVRQENKLFTEDLLNKIDKL